MPTARLPDDGAPRMRPAEFDRMFAIEDGYWWFVGKRRILASLIRDLRRADEQLLILDAGCGTGATLKEMTRLGRVVGIDYEWLPLTYCARRGLHTVAQADVCRLPFRDNAFDLVVATDLLEHLAEGAPAIPEMARILRPGGSLIVSVPAMKHLWSGHDVALGHYRRYSRGELVGTLRDAGLEVVRSTYAVATLYPVKLLVKLLGFLFFGRRPQSHTFLSIPRSLNRVLIWAMWAEAAILRHASLPFGTSLFSIARKPGRFARHDGEAEERLRPKNEDVTLRNTGLVDRSRMDRGGVRENSS